MFTRRRLAQLILRRHMSSPAGGDQVIRVTNNVASLGPPKRGPKPRQLMSLPPFLSSSDPLPGRKRRRDSGTAGGQRGVTAVSWVKHYFDDVPPDVVQTHFRNGLVFLECPNEDGSTNQIPNLRKVNHNEIMDPGSKIHLPVSVAESKINKRYDTIPTASLNPNADEIDYFRRLVIYKDSAIIVLNKPPKVPVQGNLPVHNAMDVLAAAALSYGNEYGPKLVHRLDKESSGIILFGRTEESFSELQLLFSSKTDFSKSSKDWNNACESTMQRYWALVIGRPKEKHGFIYAPLSKVLIDEGRGERVRLAHASGVDGSEQAVTEYRVLGPTINGCSWVELRPLTRLKHQLRVHCAEALGTPIVGDYKYGWFTHQKWKNYSHTDYKPFSGAPYKLRRPVGLDVQKGSVLSKVPLLHLHCREMIIPNIAKFEGGEGKDKSDLLRFVASMPNHMKISWNLMSSYLV
ncbi:hypothetical protein LUZ60_016746 [Juncus effusus]|nr:hypothetical protein LUZ60_016746 [Juncus effusus]